MKELENIKKLYPQAQEKINEIIKFYENNKNGLLSSNNLKVYDVAHYIYSEMEKDFPLTYEANKNSFDGNGIFDYFCQSEYDFFKDENNLDILQYIRNTSTFYFVPEGLKKYDNFAYCYYKNIDDFIDEIFYYILSDNYGIYLKLSDKNNIIFEYNIEMVELENIIDDITKELQTIIDFDINDFYKECLQVYTNLMDFKNNQVEIFKTYCEDEENIQKEEKEKEETEKNIVIKALNYYISNNENISEKEKNIINTYINNL